jgi:transketolase
MKTKAIVTAEEHNILGGLGESVSRVLSLNFPVPQEFVGTMDTFGESGKPSDLMKKYGLSNENIVEKVVKVTKRK